LFFLLGGVRDANSYVAIEGDELRVRFGAWVDARAPLAEVEAVRRSHWPWWGGLGWRRSLGWPASLAGTVAYVGSHSGVVEICFRQPQRMPVLPFWKPGTDRLVVSLKDP